MQLPSERSGLRCFHVSAASHWLHLGPMKIQVNSLSPYHTVIKELLYIDECDRMKGPLTRLLDGRHRTHSTKPNVPGRTSSEWTDVRVMKK